MLADAEVLIAQAQETAHTLVLGFWMKKLSHALLLAVFVFASGFSLRFVVRAAGFTSPLGAIITTFVALGFTSLARPLIVMKPPLRFQQVRSSELNGILYRALGVRSFGTLLRRSPLRYFNSAVYLGRWRGDTAAVRAQMEAAEAAHLWAIVLTIPYGCYAAFERRWSTVFWFIIFNLGLNVYPVLHLRLARGRLIALSQRKSTLHSRLSPVTAKPNR